MDNPMSSNDDDDGVPNLGGGFRYGIGVSVGVLSLVLATTLVSYYCTRARLSARGPSRADVSAVAIDIDGDSESQERPPAGLDDADLRSFPKLLYSEARCHHGMSARSASACAICLADYADSDMLRLLPECGHLFHLECVDAWLRRRPTCPVCRSSPIPTPLTTPLAEVAPLAAAGR